MFLECKRRKLLPLFQNNELFVGFWSRPVSGEPGDDEYFLAKWESSK